MIRLLSAALLAASLAACEVMAPPPPRTHIRDVVVDEAVAQVDRPYVHGGADPSGFDNSGFVYYVFQRARFRLPRSAIEQYSTGRKTTFDKIRRGDLLFYQLEGPARPELHVGIYIGRERMVHIPIQGKVTIDIIDNPYWEKRYLDTVSWLP
jgi:cell wall-associated NlpC family hydrolase